MLACTNGSHQDSDLYHVLRQILRHLHHTGVIPMSFNDQRAAQLLAICNDIGEAAYLDSQVAASLLEIFRRLPSKSATLSCLASRYGFELEEGMSGMP